MNTRLVIAIGVLAFGLGLLAYPLLFGSQGEPIVPDILIARAAPDTVIETRIVKHDVPKYVYKTVYDTVYMTQKEIVVDTIYVDREIPYFKSSKLFEFDYAKSNVFAWAECPVDSFKNELTIDWQTYFNERQKPVLMKQKFHNYLVGGALGASAAMIIMLIVQ